VTINTDNRLVTDTTVSHELWHCHTQMGMSLKDIKTMIVAGFKSAFLPFHVKQAYLRRVTEELARFTPEGEVLPSPSPTSGRSVEAFTARRCEPSPGQALRDASLAPDVPSVAMTPTRGDVPN
jgi:adenosine deaminase